MRTLGGASRRGREALPRESGAGRDRPDDRRRDQLVSPEAAGGQHEPGHDQDLPGGVGAGAITTSSLGLTMTLVQLS